MHDKSDLRRQLRTRRRALDARARRLAAEDLARALTRSPLFRRARRIACYLAVDGEMETGAVIRAAWQLGKQVYLPVLSPFGPDRLWFRRYRPDSVMTRNRFGIAEPGPRGNPLLPPRRLDLVLAPLVAFDAAGSRLGMGGGFYDRTFAYLHHRLRWQVPRIVGVAYQFQEVERLPAEPWDVPLWGVATERQLRRFNGK
jgi:5-formyltetrahydrofolate cyclo-ligase